MPPGDDAGRLPPSLAAMLDLDLLLVSGKGGVGKSAVTAALARLAARLGRRVLAVAMVDALGLSAHVGVDRLPYDPVRVAPGLYAAAVDRARALDEYLKLQLKVPRPVPTVPLTRALNLLVETAPGVREIVSMGKPVYEVWRGEWDLVIADAPSLGQLRSYLRAPTTIADLVPAGAVRRQADDLRRTLADPTSSGLLVVATPAELPVSETLEALAITAAERTIAVAGVVANRVLEPLGIPEPVIAEVAPGPARDAALLHLGLQEAQARWLARLPDPLHLPLLFGMRTPVEVSARLADLFEEALA